MENESLLDTTLILLRDRGRYREVAESTGLGYEWIAKLSQGHISDPGVNRIERLYRFLKDEAEMKAQLRAKYGGEEAAAG